MTDEAIYKIIDAFRAGKKVEQETDALGRIVRYTFGILPRLLQELLRMHEDDIWYIDGEEFK